MDNKERAITYIKNNINLIDSNNFKEFYNKVVLEGKVCGNVTSLLLEAGINPLLYMDTIPAYYLEYQDNIESINIPDNIKSIGAYAFYECSSLTKITIGDNITIIGEGAFYYCTSLTKMAIPDSVTDIEKGAFRSCTSLTSINIPNSVKKIGRFAFFSCSKLTNVIIGDSVSSIDSWAFSGCRSLKEINYKGSKEQWNLIDLYPYWEHDSSIETIHCIDGDIEI